MIEIKKIEARYGAYHCNYARILCIHKYIEGNFHSRKFYFFSWFFEQLLFSLEHCGSEDCFHDFRNFLRVQTDKSFSRGQLLGQTVGLISQRADEYGKSVNLSKEENKLNFCIWSTAFRCNRTYLVIPSEDFCKSRRADSVPFKICVRQDDDEGLIVIVGHLGQFIDGNHYGTKGKSDVSWKVVNT